ncbi:MAG: asparagine synthetase B, partial [Bacteroidia bacterium]
MRKLFAIIFILFLGGRSFASYILIPMDDEQKNHLKAYGLAYWALKGELEIHWLLNYRGGSFM